MKRVSKWRHTSHLSLGDRPLISIANGRNPETGRMAVADGIIAIGQRTRGCIAIGQMVNGNIAIGQFATGRVVAVGQLAVAPFAIGQFSIAVAAVGQMGIAGTGIFQAAVTLFGGIGMSILDLSKSIPSVFGSEQQLRQLRALST